MQYLTMAILSGGKMQATSEIMENNNVRKYINIGFKKGDNKDGVNYLEITDISSNVNKKEDARKYNYDYLARLALTGDLVYFQLEKEGAKERIKLISTEIKVFYGKNESNIVVRIPDYLQGRDCYVWWDLCDASDQSSMSEETGSAISSALENIAVILQEISGKLSKLSTEVTI